MAFNQKTIFNSVFKMLEWGGRIKKVTKYLSNRKMYYGSIRRNKELVNRSCNSTNAYVMALGPSLKQINFSKIDGDTIVVNRFFKIGKDNPDFVPTYYIMQDWKFAEETHKKDFRDALETYLPKGTIFLLNSKLYGSEHLKGYPTENIYFISNFSGNVHPETTYRLDGIMPAFQNVVGASIMSLALMGYKKITLLGCDNSHFASMERRHCYQDADTSRDSRMSWELFAYSLVAKQYDDLYLYSKKHGFEVINSTKGSLIDAFPFEIDENLYY